MTTLKKKSAMLLLISALFVPVPAAAEDFGDMFGTMFRMMLVMMNVVSDAMLDNKNDAGWDSGNSFGLGMTAWPSMYGMSGMNPVSGFGGMPGMSPWSGMNPATGFGGVPGMSPWSSPMNNNPLANPFTNAYPSGANNPYTNRGYGGYPAQRVSLLDGKWYGNEGERLEVSTAPSTLKTISCPCTARRPVLFHNTSLSGTSPNWCCRMQQVRYSASACDHSAVSCIHFSRALIYSYISKLKFWLLLMLH